MRQIHFNRETKNVFFKKNEEKNNKKKNNNNNKSYRSVGHHRTHTQTQRRRSLAVHRKSEKKKKERSRATNLSIDDDEFTQRTLHCGYFFAKRMATWEAIKPAPPVIKIFFGSYGISS